MRQCTWPILACTSLVLGLAPLRANDPAGVDFFEKKIRPVLAEQCYGCHSAKAAKLRGGLRLDTRDGIRKGGDSGPAVLPGNVKESLLLQALRHENIQMPPKGKLPAAVVADFEKWVAMGAPDPRTAASDGRQQPEASRERQRPQASRERQRPEAIPEYDFAAARKHWAFQPVRKPELPKVKNTSWPKAPIDHFILAKLEAKELSPSPPADRRTLIRRAYFDLIGLPPTYEEVQAFIRDDRPDAFARVVDRLLASPHYGERWGRHWLDVARYADTKDLVLVYGKDAIRPYAYTYRDYVVRAFNEDVPYDRFILEQLAADQIEPKVEPWRLAAMGFLTLGKLFDYNLPDIYDDQIDTVTRGFLGLTVSCARCHDHKYDAIPTADYYSLYGVFASSEVPAELPRIREPGNDAATQEFEKRLAQKLAEFRSHVEAQHREITELIRKQTTDYLQKMLEPPDPLETAIFFLSLSPNDLRPQVVARWRRYLRQRGDDDPVFGPWHDLLELSEEDFAAGAQKKIERWKSVPPGTAPGQINPLVLRSLASSKLTAKAEVARLYGELLKSVYFESQKARNGKLDAARQQLLDVLTAPDSPTYIAKSNTYLYMSRVPRDHYHNLQRQLDRMATDSPHAAPRAMVLADAEEPYEPRIFLRGNPRRLGDKVPRRFLQLLSPAGAKPFAHGSGRLELAKAIASPDNPLTARVMVNRVWMHHFGEPLVQTPDDFGVRSAPPSHPELLDWLAWKFMHDGWSLKKLHREIMLSAAYQQSSDRLAGENSGRLRSRLAGENSGRLRSGLDPESVDPDNRLLWRYNRRPLDLEPMRDALLAVSGRLDRTVGGRPVEDVTGQQNRRRTIYGLVDRQNLPNLYRVFNFANPDQSTGRRPRTTVPQQALFAMNAPFVIEQAKALAARPEVVKHSAPHARITALYRIALQRDPTDDELAAARRFVEAAAAEQATPHRSQLDPWQQFAQVLLLTNEMMFVE